MENIKSILLNGIDRDSNLIKCSEEELDFYCDKFDECRTKLRDVAWDNDNNSWDFESLEVFYEALDITNDFVVEDTNLFAFEISESILYESKSKVRQNRLYNAYENTERLPSLCDSLLMAIKYIMEGLRRNRSKPHHFSRIGELISSTTTMLTASYSSMKILDELDKAIEVENTFKARSSKGGRKKVKNYDESYAELRKNVLEIASSIINKGAYRSQANLVEQVVTELSRKRLYGGSKPSPYDAIKRWVTAYLQEQKTSQPKA